MNIDQIIKQGEGDQIEFKETFGKEAIETLCAMANRDGGVILIGVTDKAEIKGVQLGKETTRQWSNQIGQVTEPRLVPSITIHKLESKTIVSLEIASYPIKPISCSGKCYLRSGSSNKQLNATEIAELHYHSTHTSWDMVISNRSIKKLDTNLIEDYIAKVRASGRRDLKGMKDWKQILSKLELLKNGNPTWACFLLFKENSSATPSTIIRVARIKGTSTIIDDNFIEGALINQVNTTMHAVKKNLKVEYSITGKPERDEIWEYPLDALREAIVNAICHREYMDNSDILIKIYDDRLSIWNPGKLPYNLSIEQLLNNEHSSIPRNKFITQAFYDIAEVERLGSGINRIITACATAGVPTPEIKEEFGGFHVVFRKEKYSSFTGNNEVHADKKTEEIIAFIHKNKKITNSDYQGLFKVSSRTALRELMKFVEAGLLQKKGSTGKATYYLLADPNPPLTRH